MLREQDQCEIAESVTGRLPVAEASYDTIGFKFRDAQAQQRFYFDL